jgi:hypothetical protein
MRGQMVGNLSGSLSVNGERIHSSMILENAIGGGGRTDCLVWILLFRFKDGMEWDGMGWFGV